VRAVLTLALLFVFSPSIFADPVLAKIDAQVTFTKTDFSAKYTIVKDSPGEGQSVTVAAMFRRDKADRFLILILEPDADKGKGYLKIDNNLWLWDPVARRYTVTSARDRFQNSSARNADFTKSNQAGDYEVVSTTSAKLGKFDTRVLELKATSDSVTFPLRRIWVTADNLIRKMEDYSLSRQLLRTTSIPSYLQVGSQFVPESMLIVDELRGKNVNGKFVKERTQVSISEPSQKAQPDLLFTQAYLEKAR